MSSKNIYQLPSNIKFGLFCTSIFTAIFLYAQFKVNRDLSILSFCLAFIFTALTLFIPSRLGPLNRVWFELGLFLGRVVNPIVMGCIFFILITPVGLITRLMGRDILKLKKRQVSSYWVNKDPIDFDSFHNQF